MIIINRPQTTPTFNIAAEELMLKHYTDDCFAIWRNEPCIIVGKHQNTLSEIDLDYTKTNNIPVIRRLSGGGAVFHDLGNICFTFVKNITDIDKIDFNEFTLPVVELLQKLGINAKFEGRNDLTIDGKKFSGSAKCIYKNRILFHGTLLFSSEINDLTKALRADPKKYDDKAVKSVRSRVTNISEHLSEPLSVTDFFELLQKFIVNKYPNSQQQNLSNEDIATINNLIKEKYDNWDWNFGSSPRYSYNRTIRTKNAGTVSCSLDVEHGKISAIKFSGDFFCEKDIENIEKKLIGIPYKEESVGALLIDEKIREYFINIVYAEFFEVLFG